MSDRCDECHGPEDLRVCESCTFTTCCKCVKRCTQCGADMCGDCAKHYGICHKCEVANAPKKLEECGK